MTAAASFPSDFSPADQLTSSHLLSLGHVAVHVHSRIGHSLRTHSICVVLLAVLELDAVPVVLHVLVDDPLAV